MPSRMILRNVKPNSTFSSLLLASLLGYPLASEYHATQPVPALTTPVGTEEGVGQVVEIGLGNLDPERVDLVVAVGHVVAPLCVVSSNYGTNCSVPRFITDATPLPYGGAG